MCAPDDLSKPDVTTAREVARSDFESRHMRDSMPERAYDAAQKRVVGFDSVSETVSRRRRSQQAFSQSTHDSSQPLVDHHVLMEISDSRFNMVATVI